MENEGWSSGAGVLADVGSFLGEDGPKAEERGRVGKGEVAGLGRVSVQQGEEKAFLFFFLLSNFYFPFCPFFFWTKYFVDTLSV